MPAACRIALTAVLLATTAPLAGAAIITGLTEGNQLVTFDSATPGTILSSPTITGLRPGEAVWAIDFRPATGQLLALGSSSRLYSLNPLTGAATAISASAFSPTLSGNSFGFDVNPISDTVRVAGASGQNIRVNPNTGAVLAVDTPLSYTTTPRVAGAGYTNNFNGAPSTTLYDIDTASDSLVIQNPPNNGSLFLVGALGFDTDVRAGMDITTVAGVDTAYAALSSIFDNTSGLFTINLSTGHATLIGPVGGVDSGIILRDLAIAIPEPTSLSVLLLPLAFRRRRRA